MAGLVPAIHVFLIGSFKTWMPAHSRSKNAVASLAYVAGMTAVGHFLFLMFGSLRSVPMISLVSHRSEPPVRPYPTPKFTSKRPSLKSTTP